LQAVEVAVLTLVEVEAAGSQSKRQRMLLAAPIRSLWVREVLVRTETLMLERTGLPALLLGTLRAAVVVAGRFLPLRKVLRPEAAVVPTPRLLEVLVIRVAMVGLE
jgi:hypothetical protein